MSRKSESQSIERARGYLERNRLQHTEASELELPASALGGVRKAGTQSAKQLSVSQASWGTDECPHFIEKQTLPNSALSKGSVAQLWVLNHSNFGRTKPKIYSQLCF